MGLLCVRYIDDVVLRVHDANYNVVMRTDDSGRGVERMFYSAYGQPECFPFGDVDGDYDVDTNDATALTALIGTLVSSDVNILADLNLDGLITQADLNLLNTNNYMNHSGGANVLSVDTEANDVGYAGYIWNDETTQWHVRNRELSPRLGRWLQRDPAHYIDTMSLYGYVGNDPLNWVDPYGLRSCGPWVFFLTGDWCAEDDVYEAAFDGYAETANDRVNGLGDAVGIDGVASYIGGTDFTFDEMERLKGKCWAQCFAKKLFKLYLEQAHIPGLETFTLDPDDFLTNDPNDFGVTPLFKVDKKHIPGDLDGWLERAEKKIQHGLDTKEWKNIPKRRRGPGERWRQKYLKNLEEIRGLRRATSPIKKILKVLATPMLIKDVWDIVRSCESDCQNSCESGSYR